MIVYTQHTQQLSGHNNNNNKAYIRAVRAVFQTYYMIQKLAQRGAVRIRFVLGLLFTQMAHMY